MYRAHTFCYSIMIGTTYQYLRYSVGEGKSNALLKHLPNPLKDSNNF